MINIAKIRELYIARNIIDFLNESNMRELDFEKWEKYIDSQDVFTWYDDTEEGKNTLNNIDKIPDDFREAVLASFGKKSCYADFNNKKNIYNLCLIFHKKLRYIVISFNRKVTTNDLNLFLDMANYLEAYLLCNGKTIIDEKVIESLG